jgi:hypothetical protein
MSKEAAFHIVFVGWPEFLVDTLGAAITGHSTDLCSHIIHPRYTARDFPDAKRTNSRFFRDDPRQPMPDPQHDFLASLEADGVPTIHNMILGDRIVARLDYRDALAYATFLAKRLEALYAELQPSVVISSFDALHSGISLAVANRMGIPWFAPNFSVIPPGLACFCDQMSPAARVHLSDVETATLLASAEKALSDFENRSIAVPAYITPSALSWMETATRLPRRLAAIVPTLRKSRERGHVRFTEDRTAYSVTAAVWHISRVSKARRALSKIEVIAKPPESPYVFFGLHMQPESSIDVWAPFFSNQAWVIELLSRSIPPSHRLLVKIHKSDAANYTSEQLRSMRSFPGVELVEPFADSRAFVEGADLIVAIQGTVGLEAALLGKPVVVLGDSPVAMFPSVSRVGNIAELPALVREKLSEARPAREDIIRAYAKYLGPFMQAGHNDWTIEKSAEEIAGFVELFRQLKEHVVARPRTSFQDAL